MTSSNEPQETSPDQPGPAHVVDTFIELVETMPFDQITYEMISEKTAVPVSELTQRYPHILDIADDYFQQVTDRVVTAYHKDPEDTYKDTLFDLMMSFFDELNDNHTAVKNLINGMWKKTYQLQGRHNRFIKNMAAFLKASGIEAKGIRGRARQHSLGIIFVMTVRKWLEDDSDDLAKTMAELDKHLSRAEETEQKLNACPPLKLLGA